MNESAILGQLRQLSNLELVNLFLNQAGAPMATSWSDALEHRVPEAVEENRLSWSDVIQHVLETEQHGRQRVLLFQATDDVRQLLRPGQLARAIAANPIAPEVDDTGIFQEPRTLTVVRAEIQTNGDFYLKAVKMRTESETGDAVMIDGRMYRPLIETERRSVSVLRVRPNGFVECRIEQRSGANARSARYSTDVAALMTVAEPYLSFAKRKFSLSRAKERLWLNRHSLNEGFRICNVRARDVHGVELEVATDPPDATLVDVPSAAATLATFSEHNGQKDDVTISCDFFPFQGSERKRTVNARLTRKTNEIMIQARCMRSEYEHVLGGVLAHA